MGKAGRRKEERQRDSRSGDRKGTGEHTERDRERERSRGIRGGRREKARAGRGRGGEGGFFPSRTWTSRILLESAPHTNAYRGVASSLTPSPIPAWLPGPSG